MWRLSLPSRKLLIPICWPKLSTWGQAVVFSSHLNAFVCVKCLSPLWFNPLILICSPLVARVLKCISVRVDVCSYRNILCFSFLEVPFFLLSLELFQCDGCYYYGCAPLRHPFLMAWFYLVWACWVFYLNLTGPIPTYLLDVF